MKTLVRIVSLVLLVMIAPMSVIAGNSQSKTITVKKFPKNPKYACAWKGIAGRRRVRAGPVERA